MRIVYIPHIADLPMPPVLFVPLPAQSEIIITPGQKVVAGQTLARGQHCAEVCAPAAGIAHKPELRTLASPNEERVLCIPIHTSNCIAAHTADSGSTDTASNTALSPEQDNEANDIPPHANVNANTADFLRRAGIIGLGGGAMPAWRKYRPNAHTLLVNALESDNAIFCDRALLAGHAERIAAIVRQTAAFLGIAKAVVALRTDAPDIAATDDVIFRRLPADYALGAERMLVRHLFAISVPPAYTPADYGILSFNLGTVFAIYSAATSGTPMNTRIVSVKTSAALLNVRTPFGTELKYLAGFANHDGNSAQVGGRESRGALSADAVVCARTNLVDFTPPAPQPVSEPCIRCGDCLPACPENLSPMRLFALWRDSDITRMEDEESLNSCLVCRRCDEVCPSRLPLANAFADARLQARRLQSEQQIAQERGMRHEKHLRRLAELPRFAALNPAQLAEKARNRAKNPQLRSPR